MKIGLLLGSLAISFFMVSASYACSSDDQASGSKTQFVGNNGSSIHFATQTVKKK